MRLTLVRHAIAADGEDDFARPLTERGRERFARTVKVLRRMQVRFSRVLQSPKVRAVETAELLQPLNEGVVETTDLLMRPPGERLFPMLAHDGLAAVGHEPHLSALTALLVLGDAAQGHRFEVKKGAFVMLEGQVEPGGMTLVALWTPKLRRA